MEKESQSAVFEEGISYALFKVAERGLVDAAEILLRYGADLNFEGESRLRWCVRQEREIFCFVSYVLSFL